MWTGYGRRSYDVRHRAHLPLFNRPSAGPPRSCAHPRRPTGGPGCSWPPTPNSASPGRWPRIYGAPGRNPPHRTGSPQPGSAAPFGTYVHRPAAQPAHRNPPGPAQDDRPDAPTSDQQTATTCTPSPQPRQQTRKQAHPDHAEQVKTQARPCFESGRRGADVDHGMVTSRVVAGEMTRSPLSDSSTKMIITSGDLVDDLTGDRSGGPDR